MFTFAVNTCYVLDLAQTPKAWAPFANLLIETAYTALAYVSALDKLFAIAGELGAAGSTSQVMVYQTSTGQWRYSGNQALHVNVNQIVFR